MEKENLEFQNLCRTCNTTSNDLRNIFRNIENEENICFADMLMDCTSIHISTKDGLPTSICSGCVSKLQIAFEFKRQCQLVDSNLRSLLKQNDIKKELDINIDYDITEPKYEVLESFINDDHEDQYNAEEYNFEESTQTAQPLTENYLSYKVVICKICNTTFTRKEHVRRHMVVHLKCRPYVCQACNRGFNKASNLHNHEKKCEGQKCYICSICNRSFKHEDRLRVHIEMHDSNTPSTLILDSLDDIEKYVHVKYIHKPQIVLKHNLSDETLEEIQIENNEAVAAFDDEISSKTLFTNNSETEQKPSEFFCYECNKNLLNRIDLEVHKQSHFSNHLFSCVDCNKTYGRADHLKRHMISAHADEHPYKCVRCERRFSRRDHMLRHIKRSHSTNTDFVCDLCNKRYPVMELLVQHKAYKHRNSEIRTTSQFKAHKVRCKTCDTQFKTQEALAEHMESSKSNCHPKYLCSECGRRFTRNSSLQNHLFLHTGKKPYKCKYCAKGFLTMSLLQIHEKFHTGEKNYLCVTCGKRFTCATHLNRHMQRHTGIKPHACSYCNATFAQNNELQAHMRRHTGERYQCDLCNSSFILRHKLTRHKKSVHGIINALDSENINQQFVTSTLVSA